MNNSTKFQNDHNSISDIIEDCNIAPSNRVGCIQYSVIHKQISLGCLKDELINNKDGYQGSSYNSLVVIYDYMNYKGK